MVYLFKCPAPGCWYRLVLKEHESTEHSCPHSGITKIGVNVTMTLVEQVWQMLDASLTELMSLDEANITTAPELKARCRAYAEVLAIFMPPFFTTVDEIAAEARRRYRARIAGEEYTTPGLEHRVYDFPQDTKYTPPKPRAKNPPRTKPKESKSVYKLTTSEIEAIARVKGLMTEDELAVVYSTDVETIRKIWSDN